MRLEQNNTDNEISRLEYVVEEAKSEVLAVLSIMPNVSLTYKCVQPIESIQGISLLVPYGITELNVKSSMPLPPVKISQCQGCFRVSF